MERLEYFWELMQSTGEENDGFVINDDSAAEWAIRKIGQRRADTETMKTHFAAQMDKIAQRNQNAENILTAKLAEYFSTVPKRETKTQQKYILPSGELIRKQQQPEYQRDDDALVRWLESSGMEELIERKPKPLWGELKKQCAVQEDGSVVDAQSGEIVPGVVAVFRPDRFEVKLNGADL